MQGRGAARSGAFRPVLADVVEKALSSERAARKGLRKVKKGQVISEWRTLPRPFGLILCSRNSTDFVKAGVKLIDPFDPEND